MQHNRSIPDATVIPVLTYPRVREAVAWLVTVLGFVERVRIGEDHRSQLALGDGALIVADTGSARRAPGSEGVTHAVMLRVADVDGAFARAVGQGATPVMEPTDFPYGERQCTFDDPWGHEWTLSQTLADVAPDGWGGDHITAL